MNPKMTEKQLLIYEFIRSFWRKRGHAPTVREIQSDFGYASPNAVMIHLKQLQEKGFVTHAEGRARTLRIIKREAAAP